METLSDLMKKHKVSHTVQFCPPCLTLHVLQDAFHREYQEFGPVSEWNPDATSSVCTHRTVRHAVTLYVQALPVPEAARDLGKHFDLRGELATITHVGRARCRLR